MQHGPLILDALRGRVKVVENDQIGGIGVVTTCRVNGTIYRV